MDAPTESLECHAEKTGFCKKLDAGFRGGKQAEILDDDQVLPVKGIETFVDFDPLRQAVSHLDKRLAGVIAHVQVHSARLSHKHLGQIRLACSGLAADRHVVRPRPAHPVHLQERFHHLAVKVALGLVAQFLSAGADGLRSAAAVVEPIEFSIQIVVAHLI